eukprot:4545300-Prymnesium_polylepis.1
MPAAPAPSNPSSPLPPPTVAPPASSRFSNQNRASFISQAARHPDPDQDEDHHSGQCRRKHNVQHAHAHSHNRRWPKVPARWTVSHDTFRNAGCFYRPLCVPLTGRVQPYSSVTDRSRTAVQQCDAGCGSYGRTASPLRVSMRILRPPRSLVWEWVLANHPPQSTDAPQPR